ncbi:MAG: dTDP-4-dehydrorhamnose reductase [Actinomycetes bacterium]
MRILITGANGQVGHELQRAFAAHDVVAADRSSLDVSDRAAVLAAVTTIVPDAVVHTAAFTAVDACETEVERAYAVNALGVRHVGEASRRVGAHLVHLSTDYVFDGTKDGPYDEWDGPNPQSVYGRSKHAGELELLTTPDATVLRIAWVFGVHGSNIVKTILRVAADQPILRFVDDQIGRPTAAADVADLVARIVAERRPGLFHATNQGVVSWYEFARAVMEAAGHDPARVEPCATADLQPPRPAPRPANSVLDDVALRLAGLPRLPDFRETLGRVVATLGA